MLQKIAGDYGKTGSSNLLKARKDDDTGPRPDIASLCGARFVSVNEMQSGDYLDEQAVKILASREQINARPLYQNEFTYIPTAVIWLKTNHKPIIKGEDDGIWRRLILLPFERKFSENERDRNLEEKLLSQADGILEWIIEGAVKWYESGLKLSPQIISQSAQYRTESDLLGQFFEDEINLAANLRSLDSAVYYEYTRWCINNGTKALAKKRFTQKLAERGIKIEKSNGNLRVTYGNFLTTENNNWNKYLFLYNSENHFELLTFNVDIYTCNECSHEHNVYQYYTNLMLPIKPTLRECFEKMVEEEPIDRRCELCGCNKSIKKTKIWRPGMTLFIELCRFTSLPNGRTCKNNSYVDIPHEIDLSDFCDNSMKTDVSLTYKYKLKGISNHMGNMGGGHYTADCLSITDNKTWNHFDDSSVSQYTGTNINTSYAYVLLYEME